MIGRSRGKRGLNTASAKARAKRSRNEHLAGMVGAGVCFFLSSLFWPSSARAERLTLATYNLENYVTVGRMVEGVYRQNYPKPEEEKTALREVITALHADVMVFQEMGPLPFLKELQHDLAANNLIYPYGEVLEASDGERHVAILSKQSFVQIRKHKELRFSYFGVSTPVKRGLLEVTLKVGQTELTLFAVHLKSRLTERSADDQSTLRRTEEARAVRDCILREYPDPTAQRFILLGDCNDVPRSRPLAALLHRGKTRIFELLPATDSRGESWTEWYRREDSYSRIDYALVSPALSSAVVDGRAMIADGPATLTASDHRPLWLTVDLP